MKAKDKLEKLRLEREKVINGYISKDIEDTLVEKLGDKTGPEQYVIVKKIIEETEDTKSFILTPDIYKGFKTLAPFKAGQYISVRAEIDGMQITRAYSLSSSPFEALKEYRITIKRVENGLFSNYMLDKVKVGDKLVISYPLGTFGLSKIRDEKNVIAIAGGSGITPFISLAYSCSKDDYFKLTVFYSVKYEKDILFKQEIKELNKNKNVKFVITLTREEKKGYKFGYISEEMLKPYVKEFNTVLMCGPKALYKTMNTILPSFKIPKKNVFYENFFLEYTSEAKNTFELKVVLKSDLVITSCQSDETLLVAMEKAGIKAPSMCRVGMCGFCRSMLISGKVKMVGKGLKEAERQHDYIHPCITYPESDITLRLDI